MYTRTFLKLLALVAYDMLFLIFSVQIVFYQLTFKHLIFFFQTNTETFEIFATIVTLVAFDWEIQI